MISKIFLNCRNHKAKIAGKKIVVRLLERTGLQENLALFVAVICVLIGLVSTIVSVLDVRVGVAFSPLQLQR